MSVCTNCQSEKIAGLPCVVCGDTGDKNPLVAPASSRVSSCSACNYTCKTGTDGGHSCVEHLLKRIKKLERDWKLENRIIELLIVGGFVKREKAEKARQLLDGTE